MVSTVVSTGSRFWLKATCNLILGSLILMPKQRMTASDKLLLDQEFSVGLQNLAFFAVANLGRFINPRSKSTCKSTQNAWSCTFFWSGFACIAGPKTKSAKVSSTMSLTRMDLGSRPHSVVQASILNIISGAGSIAGTIHSSTRRSAFVLRSPCFFHWFASRTRHLKLRAYGLSHLGSPIH